MIIDNLNEEYEDTTKISHGELSIEDIHEHLSDYCLLLCNKCGGRGVIYEIFKQHTCPICQGSGTIPIKNVQ